MAGSHLTPPRWVPTLAAHDRVKRAPAELLNAAPTNASLATPAPTTPANATAGTNYGHIRLFTRSCAIWP